MSMQARQELCSRLIFQDGTQQSDLMNPDLTNTDLIALMLDVTNGCPWEVTAVRSDHHDDTDLNPTPPHQGTHANGWALDGWPLNSKTPGDYMDANSEAFEVALGRARQSSWIYQVGLTPDAYTEANREAAGPTVFEDDGGSHVHLGA